MSAPQKAALSLLISVLLFAGFTVLAFSGLFAFIQTHFYNPSVVRSLTREIQHDARVIDRFFSGLEDQFAATLSEPVIRRSFLPNQSGEDIFERSRIYGVLMESVAGLQSVRFVDSGGVRIHFSTRSEDILRREAFSVAYRNYDDDPAHIPYKTVEAGNLSLPRIILDGEGDRIVFAWPFYDAFDVYRGTALFTLSIRAVSERLTAEGRISVGEEMAIISAPAGMVSRMPGAVRSVLNPLIASLWKDNHLSLHSLDSAGSPASLAIISAKTSQGIFVGRLVDKKIFIFPDAMKAILLAAAFITLYLSVFLIFNLRQDAMTVIQNRLKNLQISLIEQYYERKGNMDWDNWSRELEQRREDVRAEIKRGVRIKKGRHSGEVVDSLIDKSWDELLAVIAGKRPQNSSLDEEKIEAILNRLLEAISAVALPPVQTAAVSTAPALSARIEDEEELEELEVVEDEPEAKLAMTEPVKESEKTKPVAAAPQTIKAEEKHRTKTVEVEKEKDEAAALLRRRSAVTKLSDQIEFITPIEEEAVELPAIGMGMGMVSPFSTSMYNAFIEELEAASAEEAETFSLNNGGKTVIRQDTGLEESFSLNSGLSFIYQPFGIACRRIETISSGDPIEEKNGIHYINHDVLSVEPPKRLDPAFKSLVDSVMR